MSARRLLAVALALSAPALALPALALAAAAAPADTGSRVATAAPVVAGMVVGRGGSVLFGAPGVSASATSLRVASRSCAVAAGTPLAALAAMRRAGGPAFALRDYGHCGSSPRNSAELFVNDIGGERNRGQDGWEYKVSNVAGSTGAADPSGTAGDGRLLRSGEHVLWFWCSASRGGCEHTLEAAPASARVRPRSSLQVTVREYDNEGRGSAVARAVLTLGTDFATTGANGRATLIAPSSPGSYPLRASRSGLVPSFPQTITVR